MIENHGVKSSSVDDLETLINNSGKEILENLYDDHEEDIKVVTVSICHASCHKHHSK